MVVMVFVFFPETVWGTMKLKKKKKVEKTSHFSLMPLYTVQYINTLTLNSKSVCWAIQKTKKKKNNNKNMSLNWSEDIVNL